MPPPTTNEGLIEYIHSHFVKGGSSQIGARPGFAHALKLSYHLIDNKRVNLDGPDDKYYNYRYALSEDVPKFTIGLLCAAMDELSTNACFRVGLPAPPGMSLQMQTELVPRTNSKGKYYENPLDDPTLKELDMITCVTKLGRTVSYTRTDYVCVETGDLIGFSSHVKYMPTGSRLFNFILSTQWIYEAWEKYFLRSRELKMYEEKALFGDVIANHLEYKGLGRATFNITLEHTNPYASMHGGCHAMVMEEVVTSYAREELKCETVGIQSIQIDYIGAAKGTVDVVCETIGKVLPSQNGVKREGSLYVRVKIQRGDRISSEGKMRIVSIS